MDMEINNIKNTKAFLLITTFDNYEYALKVINSILSNKFAMCASLKKIESIFHWEDEVKHCDEYEVSFKVSLKQVNHLKKEVIALHSYEIPQILVVPIIDSYDKYLNWLDS